MSSDGADPYARIWVLLHKGVFQTTPPTEDQRVWEWAEYARITDVSALTPTQGDSVAEEISKIITASDALYQAQVKLCTATNKTRLYQKRDKAIYNLIAAVDEAFILDK